MPGTAATSPRCPNWSPKYGSSSSITTLRLCIHLTGPTPANPWKRIAEPTSSRRTTVLNCITCANHKALVPDEMLFPSCGTSHSGLAGAAG